MELGGGRQFQKLPGSSGSHRQCFYHSSPRQAYDVSLPLERASMRQNILDTVEKRTESHLSHSMEKENPLYEDPRDIIGGKPQKPPRRRNKQPVITSPRLKDKHCQVKDQKRRLTKKYESLITTLINKCEENVVLISEKNAQLMKLKEKLKAVLQYNRLFAEENDRLKSQQDTLVKYIEECKAAIKEERERSGELEKKSRDLADRMRQFELPDRDQEHTTAVPLVEVCMSCSNRQILLNQSREQNTRFQRDMQALKDLLYRLNVQLSKYQEKIRANVQNLAMEATDTYKPGGRGDFESLVTGNLGSKGPESIEGTYNISSKGAEELLNAKMVDLSGLLSAQAIAPLFDAYQENLQEKDNLIQDYEKQFENINKKSKLIVEENKTLQEKLNSVEGEFAEVRRSYKKLVLEKETADIEKVTLVERAERAEEKLKEVYELYEHKISTMMRDYETVHRSYLSVKHALQASQGKMAALDCRTVPADMHQRTLQHCTRLLEELKHQYTMESDRKAEQIKKLQDALKVLEEKHGGCSKELELVREQLQDATRNAKLYRKAAEVFRKRFRMARSSVAKIKKRARKKRCNCQPEKLRDAMFALQNIKMEIKAVKTKASASLELLERRILEQQDHYASVQQQSTKELMQRDKVIRSLVDNDTLNQTETRRLIGIVSSSDQSSPAQTKQFKEKDKRTK